MNPRFGRRTWVKLWVNEWLDGTTRFEMTDSQRAFWIDLLAMAGRSRFPGIVCAGKTPEGKLIGYPINKFQSLMSEPIHVEETLDLFARTGKVSIEETSAEPIRLLAIKLLNWNKYQSEYQRQKPYRQKGLQQSDKQSYSKGNKTEVEVDSEVDTETEKEVKTLRQNLKSSPSPEVKRAEKQLQDAQKELREKPNSAGAKRAFDEAMGLIRKLAAKKAMP